MKQDRVGTSFILSVIFICCLLNWNGGGFSYQSSPYWLLNYSFGREPFFNLIRPGTLFFFFPGIIGDLLFDSLHNVIKLWSFIPSFVPFFYCVILFHFIKPWRQREYVFIPLCIGMVYRVIAADEGGLAMLAFFTYFSLNHILQKKSNFASYAGYIFLFVSTLTHEIAIIFAVLTLFILLIMGKKTKYKQWFWGNVISLILAVSSGLIFFISSSYKIRDFIARNRLGDSFEIVSFNSHLSGAFFLLFVVLIIFLFVPRRKIRYGFIMIYGVLQWLFIRKFGLMDFYELKNLMAGFYCLFIVKYFFVSHVERGIKNSGLTSLMAFIFSLVVVISSYNIGVSYANATAFYDSRPASCEIFSSDLLEKQLGNSSANIDQFSFIHYYLIFGQRNAVTSKNPKVLLAAPSSGREIETCTPFLLKKARRFFGRDITEKALKYYPLKYFRSNL